MKFYRILFGAKTHLPPAINTADFVYLSLLRNPTSAPTSKGLTCPSHNCHYQLVVCVFRMSSEILMPNIPIRQIFTFLSNINRTLIIFDCITSFIILLIFFWLNQICSNPHQAILFFADVVVSANPTLLQVDSLSQLDPRFAVEGALLYKYF